MDELNQVPGAEPATNLSDSDGDTAVKPANGQPKKVQSTSRSITSKRVVIPADAKRAKRTAAATAPEQATVAPVPTDIPASVSQDTAAAPSDAAPALAASDTLASTALTDHTAADAERDENAVPRDESALWTTTIAASQDERTLVPGMLSEPRREADMGGRGLHPTTTPYLPDQAALAAGIEKPKRGNRVLEFALWGIAILLLAATAYFVLPLFFPNLFSNPEIVSNPPTATVAAAIAPTNAPSPTTTLLPTEAPTQSTAAQIPTSSPLIIPTPPPDGEQISLLADSKLSGWVTDASANVNYGDVSLVAGTNETQSYTSILQFNLRNLPTTTKILFAVLELTGRDDSKLAPSGEWQIELVENPLGTDWSTATTEQIATAKSLGVIGTLPASELGNGRLNRIFFDTAQMQALEQQFKSGNAVLRIRGPQSDGDNLFAWESGVSGSAVNAPTLHLVAVPGKYVVVTNTPAPRNVLTAAAYVVRGTDAAKRNGTPTPFPPGVATATPGGEQVEIPVETALAGNDATAIARAQLATAIARTTGTYTPTPKGVILIFPTFTPVVISPNELATATPIAPDANLLEIPIDYEKCNCQGRILLYSTRYGGEKAYPIMIEPDGTELGKLSGDLYYRLAVAREQYSPDRTRRIIYPNDSRGVQQIGIEEIATGEIKFLTNFPKGIAYDAAWAPDGSAIVFVSTEKDNADQIYLYDFGTEQISVLIETPGGQPWFKRPSWSPDSQKIVYWSSVSGRKQIWVMNRDGTDQVNISNNTFNEFDPVWVK
jgi:hypothetical protein